MSRSVGHIATESDANEGERISTSAVPFGQEVPPSDLLERLQQPGAPALKADLIEHLRQIEARLSLQMSQMQSAERMAQLNSARLAVQTASAILARLKVPDPASDGPGGSQLHSLFGSSQNDQ
jgi:hypothetical protein